MSDPPDSSRGDRGPLDPPPSKLVDVLLSVLVVAGYGAPVHALVGGVLAAIASHIHQSVGWIMGGFGALTVFVLLVIAVYRGARNSGRGRILRAAEVLVLAVLPVWGLAYSHFFGEPGCVIDQCQEGSVVFRPFAEPEVFGLVALHALTVLAYFVSRRRPEKLRPAAESLVHAALLAGIVIHAITAVHVARWSGVGIALAPVFLPCLGSALTVVFYIAELRARLRRRGLEAATDPGWDVLDSPYRQGPAQQDAPLWPRVHRGMLLRALALAPALLGVHAVIHALWLGRADGALRVFTRTCGHVLSTVPIEVLPGDCHYLCTVAARGHGWLVRPERLGKRRGVTIVVNRQLAIANAFEDLLHERWPRFGRLARRIYDRVGLPICRYLRRPWLADLTYLAMKPAEWLFAIALLLLDRGDPERRIDRMYR